MTEDITLRDYFSMFGKIVDFKLVRDHHTKQSKCYGFITFENDSSLEKVIGTEPHYIDGNEVKIGVSKYNSK